MEVEKNFYIQARLAHYQCSDLAAPLDFGLVGFAYAAALGAEIASPDYEALSALCKELFKPN